MKILLSIHHAALSVANLDETIRWYKDKLGFEEEFRYEFLQTKAAFIHLGELQIELFEVEGAAAMPATRSEVAKDLQVHGMKHIGLKVRNLNEARSELESKGVEFITPINEVSNSGGSRYTFFHDNNGIIIELYEQH